VARKSVALPAAVASISNKPEALAPLSHTTLSIEASRATDFLAARVPRIGEVCLPTGPTPRLTPLRISGCGRGLRKELCRNRDLEGAKG
jgi:hypothetical protein